jgi:RPA family protein
MEVNMVYGNHRLTRTIQNQKFVRQPALRLFAAELAESKQTIIEHIEGRDFDSRYQLTPTGVKVKRVLMMGALVEVDNIGSFGDYLRGRIIDPTGAFTVYAGQYQPAALLALSSLTAPCFVAVVGKTSAYRPDEKTTIISIKPETIVEIDAKTRDYWVKDTVAKTLERVEKSQLPEVEKKKYRQMCRDALTKLVYMHMPQETNIPIQETPIEAIPEQDENIPASPTIEQHEKNDKNLSGCYEPDIGFLRPILVEEKPSLASGSEKHPEDGYVTSKSNDSLKRKTKKKIIKREPANRSQKTLFEEMPDTE